MAGPTSSNVLNNSVYARNLYPARRGATSTQIGAPDSPAQAADPSDFDAGHSETLVPLQKALQIGLLGEPIRYWILLTLLLFGGMWAAQKFASGGATFANLKFSFYNILAVVIIAIVGVSIAKVIFTRFPIAGISTIVLAA